MIAEHLSFLLENDTGYFPVAAQGSLLWESDELSQNVYERLSVMNSRYLGALDRIL